MGTTITSLTSTTTTDSSGSIIPSLTIRGAWLGLPSTDPNTLPDEYVRRDVPAYIPAGTYPATTSIMPSGGSFVTTTLPFRAVDYAEMGGSVVVTFEITNENPGNPTVVAGSETANYTFTPTAQVRSRQNYRAWYLTFDSISASGSTTLTAAVTGSGERQVNLRLPTYNNTTYVSSSSLSGRARIDDISGTSIAVVLGIMLTPGSYPLTYVPRGTGNYTATIRDIPYTIEGQRRVVGLASLLELTTRMGPTTTDPTPPNTATGSITAMSSPTLFRSGIVGDTQVDVITTWSGRFSSIWGEITVTIANRTYTIDVR